MSAMDGFLDANELVEMMLSHLPPEKLLAARRINKQFKKLIDTSPSLQRCLFLKEDTNDGEPASPSSSTSSSEQTNFTEHEFNSIAFEFETSNRLDPVFDITVDASHQSLLPTMMVTKPAVSYLRVCYTHGRLRMASPVRNEAGVRLQDVINAIAKRETYPGRVTSVYIFVPNANFKDPDDQLLEHNKSDYHELSHERIRVLKEIKDTAPTRIRTPHLAMRDIIERSATNVSEQGHLEEVKLQLRSHYNTHLSFIHKGSAYHPYYMWRLAEAEAGKGRAREGDDSDGDDESSESDEGDEVDERVAHSFETANASSVVSALRGKVFLKE
jgi:hypothetical protein